MRSAFEGLEILAPTKELKCKICGRPVLSREDLTATVLDNKRKMVYHRAFGVACLSHTGVKDMFKSKFRDKMFSKTVQRLRSYNDELDRVWAEFNDPDVPLINRIKEKLKEANSYDGKRYQSKV